MSGWSKSDIELGLIEDMGSVVSFAYKNLFELLLPDLSVEVSLAWFYNFNY